MFYKEKLLCECLKTSARQLLHRSVFQRNTTKIAILTHQINLNTEFHTMLLIIDFRVQEALGILSMFSVQFYVHSLKVSYIFIILIFFQIELICAIMIYCFDIL